MDINFFVKYMEILSKSGYQDADLFKDIYIPDRLYKYFPPEPNRLEALKNHKLWLAQYDAFKGDPNEFRFMQLNENYFETEKLPYNINYSIASQWLDKIKHVVSISCFTTSFQNPNFWKHYAADYTGFCVEYKVEKKNLLYPVIYTDTKIDISEFACNFIISTYNTIIKEKQLEEEWHKPINLVTDESMDDISFFYFNYCAKETTFDWEDEFRIVYSNPQPQTEPGLLIPYKNLGIVPINIYFYPEKCNSDIIPILKEIGDDSLFPIFP